MNNTIGKEKNNKKLSWYDKLVLLDGEIDKNDFKTHMNYHGLNKEDAAELMFGVIVINPKYKAKAKKLQLI